MRWKNDVTETETALYSMATNELAVRPSIGNRFVVAVRVNHKQEQIMLIDLRRLFQWSF